MESKEKKLVETLLGIGFVKRTKLFVELDLLHEGGESLSPQENVRLALIKARDSERIMELATLLSEVSSVPLYELIDTDEKVSHSSTDVFILKTLDEVLTFCSNLVSYKQKTSFSSVLTLSITIDRETRYRRPLGVLEVASKCHPSNFLKSVLDTPKVIDIPSSPASLVSIPTDPLESTTPDKPEKSRRVGVAPSSRSRR